MFVMLVPFLLQLVVGCGELCPLALLVSQGLLVVLDQLGLRNLIRISLLLQRCLTPFLLSG
jgi:hypothetical protein